MPLKVYVLSSCDACRKAVKWLDENAIPHEAINIRKQPFERAELDALIARAGMDIVFNTRSTTWRNMPDAEKSDLDAARAAELIMQVPTLMKRPLFVGGEFVVGGFSEVNRGKLKQM